MRGLNVLPWRENLRQHARKKLLLLLLTTLLMVLIFSGFIHGVMGFAFKKQKQDLKSLKHQSLILDQRRQRLLRSKTQSDLARLRFQKIHELSLLQSIISRFLSELSTVVPQDLVIKNLVYHERHVVLVGKFVHHHALMQLIKNMKHNPLFSNVRWLRHDYAVDHAFKIMCDVGDMKNDAKV